MSKTVPSYLLTALYALALVLVFVGERLVASGGMRAGVTSVGLVLVVLALVLRAARMRSVVGERQNVERALLGLGLVGLLALILYFIPSDVFARLWAKPLDQTSPKLTGILNALWPVGLVVWFLPSVLVELAYLSMSRAVHVELGRIRDALLSGLGMAATLVFAFAAFYVADERDVKADLSYFRTARPGQATRSIVRTLTAPVTASLFFPPHNDVGVAVTEYFRDLAKESPKFELQSYDQAVDPAKAKELGVSGNGAIVIQRGQQKEQFLIGLDLERARSELRTLDGEIQKRILTVARTKRTFYFTTGHGERGESRLTLLDQRPTLRLFRDMLRAQNAEMKDLGAAEGLANEVPKDAAAVLVMGPNTDFMPEEIATLKRYVEGGGRLLLALDPEAKLPFAGLVAPWGVTFVATTLCNDKVFVPQMHQPSDHALLATSSFSSHPAVTTLSQLGTRVGVVFLGAGYFDMQHEKPLHVSLDVSVKAQPETWNDVNGNFAFDGAPETRKAYGLVVSASVRHGTEQGRAVLVADSDAFTDLVFENPGNAYLAMDVIKWLTGDEATAGTVEKEVDAPLEHTRGQDVVWFYSTVFVVPGLVLAAGYAVNRRKRRTS